MLHITISLYYFQARKLAGEQNMPPSGFKQDAINGLLTFVEECYKTVNETYTVTGISEDAVLAQAMGDLERLAANATTIGVSPRAVQGLATFMQLNYRDLCEELRVGKKDPEQALATEMLHIGTYLERFKLPTDIEAMKPVASPFK